MKIGEFAKLCGTRVSLLRHYDKIGLLSPAFTDVVTGYRLLRARAGEDLPIDRCAEERRVFFAGDAPPVGGGGRRRRNRRAV